MKNTEPKTEKNMIFGRNPVAEALRSGREIDSLTVQRGATGSVGKILSMAKSAGIPIDFKEKEEMDRLAKSGGHQGVIAFATAYKYASLDELLDILEEKQSKASEPADSLLVILDEIEDPHNLGAILRTAECAGARGVIIPKRRAAGVTETVAKVSAGAVEYIPIARVTNLVRAIEELKSRGYWVLGMDMDGTDYTQADLKGKIALVCGNEGRGLGRLVRENCDYIISIPLMGKISSLNASNATAVVLYEALRQRSLQGRQ